MNKSTFDPAQPLLLYFRCARNGTIDFIFTDSNSNPYSLIYEDIEFHVYQNEGDKKPVFSLTPGNGLSFPSTGTVRASVTIAQTNINEGQYYYELYRPDLGKTWIADYAIFHNGRFDGLQENGEGVTVSDGNNEINISVYDGGAFNTRSISTTSTATLTPNVDLYDLFVISAQAAALTIANPTGTAVLGNGFMIDLEDNGTARAITFGNLYASTFVTLPTTTILGKRMKLVFQYNGTNWELLNVINEL